MKKKRSQAQIDADSRRTGRPPGPPEERRGERVMVYLTRAELARFEVQAQQEGLTLAALIMRPWREKGV